MARFMTVVIAAALLASPVCAELIEYQITGELFPTLSNKEVSGPFTGTMTFEAEEPATAFHLLVIPELGDELEGDFSMVNNLWDGFGEVDIRQFATSDLDQEAVFQMTAWDNDPALIFDPSIYGDDNDNGLWDNWQFHWEVQNPLGVHPISGSISSLTGPQVTEPSTLGMAGVGGILAFAVLARRRHRHQSAPHRAI